jgi:hypothetical protein
VTVVDTPPRVDLLSLSLSINARPHHGDGNGSETTEAITFSTRNGATTCSVLQLWASKISSAVGFASSFSVGI